MGWGGELLYLLKVGKKVRNGLGTMFNFRRIASSDLLSLIRPHLLSSWSLLKKGHQVSIKYSTHETPGPFPTGTLMAH